MSHSSILNNEEDKKFIVYTSSAGSGKTYTLSRFFIKLLMQGNDSNYFRTIAALTFTNKAANEMKERIFGNLVLLSLSEYSNEHQQKESQNLLNDYSNYLKKSKEEIQEKSKKIVSEILHNYSDLTVQTIDKFTHKIIRPFSKDLDISPDFSIELNEDDIISKSIDLLLQKSSSDEMLSTILLDFAYHKVEEGKRFQAFENDILELSKVFKKENAIEYLKEYKSHNINFFFDKKEEIKKHRDNIKKEIVEHAKSGLKCIADAGLSVEDFFQSKSGVGSFFYKNALGDIVLEPNSYVLKALNEDVWYSSSSKHKATIDSISVQLGGYLKSIVNKLPDYINYNFLYSRIFPTALLNEVDMIIEDVKSSQNILTISDFNKLISNLIATSHLSVPFLYERIGERYNHYLIDEFQDTSILQWNNMIPLIDDALSKGNQNLLVGDAKQAIYRFRNGDVEQFISLPKLPHKPNSNYDFFESTLNRNFLKDTLNTNYRSYSAIIQFNNELFQKITPSLSEYHQKIYSDVNQNNTDKVGGFVNVEFSEDKDDKVAPLSYTLNSIHKAIESNFDLSEIAILVRSRKEINQVAEYLIEHNIEVISEASLKLTYSADVKKIIETYKYLVNPSNKLQAAKLILTINPSIDKRQLQKLISTNAISDYLSKEYAIFPNILGYSLLDSLGYLVQSFDINQDDSYYLQFKSFVWEKFKTHGYSISDFINYWQTLEDNEMLPSLKNISNGNAVQILTVHKSKGLQYPVVIIPFANWKTDFMAALKWINPKNIDGLDNLVVNIKPNTLKNTLYSDVGEGESNEAFLEALNILYVAVTRAEEQLYIFSNPKGGIGQQLFLALQDKLQNNVFNEGIEKRISTKKIQASQNSFVANSSTQKEKIILNIAPESSKYWTENEHMELDYGNIFHNIMSEIQTQNDLNKTIDKVSKEDNLTSIVRDNILQDISKMFENEYIQEMFNPTHIIFNEKEILYKNQALRLDKLSLRTDGTALLLDFKTGDKKDTDLKQVSSYLDALDELGFKEKQAAIYYTKYKELIKL